MSACIKYPQNSEPYCPAEHTLRIGDITAVIGRNAFLQECNGNELNA